MGIEPDLLHANAQCSSKRLHEKDFVTMLNCHLFVVRLRNDRRHEKQSQFK